MNIIARTTKSVLKNNVKFAFCLNKALLDPSKHITMNHQVHNMYIDQYDIGKYPEIVTVGSIPARTYQTAAVSNIVKIINARYVLFALKQGVSLTEDDFIKKSGKTWDRFLIKDLKTTDNFENLIPAILNSLAINIFVRESRWTWVRQQKERLQFSSSYFSHNRPQTLADFLQSYNDLIEELVLASTFGQSPDIPQSPTPLQKHYVHQMTDQVTGVEQLNKLEGQNNNLINKMMAFLHKV